MLLTNILLQRKPPWPEEMVSVSRYEESSLQDCVAKMQSCAAAAHTNALQAVHRKYASMTGSASWLTFLRQPQKDRGCHGSQTLPRREEIPSGIYGVTYTTELASEPRTSSVQKRCLSVESRCELHKCPAQRMAIHRQAFEGSCRHTVSKLKGMCKARRLPCSGTKEELALRLIDVMFHH